MRKMIIINQFLSSSKNTQILKILKLCVQCPDVIRIVLKHIKNIKQLHIRIEDFFDVSLDTAINLMKIYRRNNSSIDLFD